MDIVDISTAISLGAKVYFTGIQCRNGHVSTRSVKNKICNECNRERARRFARDFPEIKKAQDRAYAIANPAVVAEKKRLWDLANPGASAARTRAWSAANPLMVLTQSRNKRARKRSASGTHTAQEILALLQRQKNKCVNCKISIKEEYHADHIMPLALNGSNDIRNIQLLCPTCNMRKHKKHPAVWAQQEGRLI